MDLENLTKEELAEIEANPLLSKAYKSLLSDYTKKTQGIAGVSRQLEDFQAQLADANSYIDQWEAYGKQLEPILKQIDTGEYNINNGNKDRGAKSRNTKQDDDLIDQLVSRIEGLESYLKRASDSVSNEVGKLHRMFDMGIELNELQFQRFNETGKFDLDVNKIISEAETRKIPSLKDAFGFAYKDDFIKTAAEKRADEIVKERDAKYKTEEGDHRVKEKAETVFKLSPDRPKNFGEATEQALNEVGKDTNIGDKLRGGKDEK